MISDQRIGDRRSEGQGNSSELQQHHLQVNFIQRGYFHQSSEEANL